MERETLKEIVKKEIAVRLVNGQCFTYFDIASDISSFLPNADIDRKEVKELSNEIFNDCSLSDWREPFWKKTLCKLNNCGGQVFVLHPADKDPQEYVNVIDPLADNQPSKLFDVLSSIADGEDRLDELERDVKDLASFIKQLIRYSDDVCRIGQDLSVFADNVTNLQVAVEEVIDSDVYEKWS